MWKARASGSENRFLNRSKVCDSMTSALYNIVFTKNVSSWDRLQNMILHVCEHWSFYIRSWFFMRSLDYELCDCRQSNAFTRRLSLPSLMEMPSCCADRYLNWWSASTIGVFERRVLSQVAELRSVENQRELIFCRLYAAQALKSEIPKKGKRIFCTTSTIQEETRKTTYAISSE